jgi:hypothetical protein
VNGLARRTAVWGLLALAGVAVTLAVDRAAPGAVVDADGWLDRPFFRDFSAFHAEGFRIASPTSALHLAGLWPDGLVDVSLAVASALPKGQEVQVFANGTLAHRSDVGGRYGILRFTARTDDAGVLALRLEAPRARAPEALRVTWVRVRASGPSRWPWRRAPLYAAVLALTVAGAAWAGATGRSGAIALALATVALGLGLVLSRLLLLHWLPRGCACAAAGLLLAALASRAFSFPRAAAAWWGAVLAFRCFLLPLPDVASIDLTFHAHNIERFQRGEVLGSAVSDAAGQPVFIPYPPALYAVLAPFVPVGDTAAGEAAVRWAMIVLEGTVPLLVFGLMRSAGADTAEAALAAIAASVMPEGLLVLPKGVAANVTGAWLALVATWAVVARASPVIVAGAAALAFLGHPGSAASFAGLVAVWALLAAYAGAEPRRRALTVVAATAAGALLAWLVYYREVAELTRDSLGHFGGEASHIPGRFGGVRWVHLGKMAQDVALKFGLGPFALATLGLAAGPPSRLRPLVHAWLVVTAGLAAFALLTPVALRFEYFVAPALAMAAGVGAARQVEAGRGAWVTVAFAVALGIQVALGLAIHSGWFDLINVIIPSPRWPLVL